MVFLILIFLCAMLSVGSVIALILKVTAIAIGFGLAGVVLFIALLSGLGRGS